MQVEGVRAPPNNEMQLTAGLRSGSASAEPWSSSEQAPAAADLGVRPTGTRGSETTAVSFGPWH
jgi:hypothetical protein